MYPERVSQRADSVMIQSHSEAELISEPQFDYDCWSSFFIPLDVQLSLHWTIKPRNITKLKRIKSPTEECDWLNQTLPTHHSTSYHSLVKSFILVQSAMKRRLLTMEDDSVLCPLPTASLTDGPGGGWGSFLLLQTHGQQRVSCHSSSAGETKQKPLSQAAADTTACSPTQSLTQTRTIRS